jgi:hypothetical protein
MNQMTLGSQKQNAVNAHEQSIHLNLRPDFFSRKCGATVPPAESTA